MKKSQAAIPIIIGILIVVIIYFLIPKKITLENNIDASLNIKEFESYFTECAKITVIDANLRIGIHESVKKEYEEFVSLEIKECANEFLEKLKEKGMEVKDASAKVLLEINDQNAIVKIEYPISIRYKTFDYIFSGYAETFDKVTRIDLKESIGSPIYSTDKNMIIEADEILLKDSKGNLAKEVYIKISDKRDENGDMLEGNLVYGIYPIGYYSDSPIRIKLNAKDIVFAMNSPNKLRLAWQNPFSKKWHYFADTKIEDGYLTADTYYTTNYAVMNEIIIPSNIPILSTNDIHQGTSEAIPLNGNQYSQSSGLFKPTSPKMEYGIIDGEVEKIFYTIRNEMGGTYDLAPISDCVPKGAYCWVGASDKCSPAAVYCTEIINKLSNRDKNILFRHEIAHNIQQNNNGCPYSATAFKEWGPEYYSGSTYYKFAMEKGNMLAQDAAKLMLERDGCTEQIIKDAAFCVPNAYEKLARYCLKPGELESYSDSGLN